MSNISEGTLEVDIENKFSAHGNYSEGEYFLGKKIGVWNYYMYANGEKKKIASEKYVLKIPPALTNFKIGMPMTGIICGDWPELPDPMTTEQIIYNYETGNVIIGYYYDLNRNVIKVVK